MLDINFIKDTGLFELISLQENEILFDEGDIDNNLYIIENGEIIVEKGLSGEVQETKVLAIISSGDIFGEGSLNNSDPKQVRIRAKTNSILLKIDTQNNIGLLLERYPREGLELFKEIINTGNKRVLKANALITANYEMDKTISHLEKIDKKAIYLLIDKFKDIIKSEYILYIENNPVIQNYLSIRYDTRNKGKMLDIIVEGNSKEKIKSALKEENIQLEAYNYVIKLNIADTDLGYLIVGSKQREFSEDEKKIITSISNSLCGIIRQQILLDEQRDKEFMEE